MVNKLVLLDLKITCSWCKDYDDEDDKAVFGNLDELNVQEIKKYIYIYIYIFAQSFAFWTFYKWCKSPIKFLIIERKLFLDNFVNFKIFSTN